MPTYTSLRMWVNDVVTYAITAVDDTANTVTIAGDHTILFPAGSKFRIGAATSDYAPLNGLQTVQTTATLVAGDTLIPIAAFVLGGTSGNKGSILYYPFTDVALAGTTSPTFAKSKPAFNTPGAIFQSREGLKLRVIPANTTDLKRFVHTFQVSFPINFGDQIARDGTLLDDWLQAYALDLSTTFTFFMEKHGVNPGGSSYTRKRAFKGMLEDVPNWLYGDGWAGANSEELVMSFTCTGDGVYTDYEDFTSTTYRSRT